MKKAKREAYRVGEKSRMDLYSSSRVNGLKAGESWLHKLEV
jgi:hypothetical protein